MERDLGRYLGVHCALMNRTKEKEKKKPSIIWKPAATEPSILRFVDISST